MSKIRGILFVLVIIGAGGWYLYSNFFSATSKVVDLGNEIYENIYTEKQPFTLLEADWDGSYKYSVYDGGTLTTDLDGNQRVYTNGSEDFESGFSTATTYLYVIDDMQNLDDTKTVTNPSADEIIEMFGFKQSSQVSSSWTRKLGDLGVDISGEWYFSTGEYCVKRQGCYSASPILIKKDGTAAISVQSHAGLVVITLK